jgi:hypothetical protein
MLSYADKKVKDDHAKRKKLILTLTVAPPIFYY